MGFENRHKINGQDCWTKWGIWFERGVHAELLKFPKRKEVYTENWPDESGTVRNSSLNVYESTTLNLTAMMIGNDEDDFLTKLSAFRTYITTAGYFNFDDIRLNMRFTLIFDSMTNYKQHDRISLQNDGLIRASFNLVLIDDQPTNHPAIP